MSTRPIRFVHRHTVIEIDAAAPTRTVLEWLREDARCTGTKEGCAEGDCGACTVVVGELDGQGGLALAPVNACIRFLPTLDGKVLFTVEDLAGSAGALHPTQQAMVDHHGSQCGFCTPGFVMSLWAAYERHQAQGTRPSRQRLADDLSGNLCRCTGYRPILDAGEHMFDAPAALLDRAAVVALLQRLQPLGPEPPLPGGFHAPRTLAEFAALRAARPLATVLAGGTDIGLWVNKQFRDPGELISIHEVTELRRIEVTASHITIGAAASLQEAWRALVAEWPALRDLWLRFASLSVREAGTMGGNVANGSPIGDSAPVLMALAARIVLRRGERVRTLPLEAFYLDYMKNCLEPGEFVQALVVPRFVPGRAGHTQAVRAYKISKRFDCDISAVCAAFAIELEGDRILQARLAWGGMAATVRRAPQAEAALRGQAWAEPALQAAMAALVNDFEPLTDVRASSAYRMQVAQNLLRRCWLETRPVDPLAEHAVSVFARQEQA